MEKITFINSSYKPSETLRVKCSDKQVREYVDKGYFHTYNNCGHHVFTKPAEINVKLKDSDGTTFTRNLKREVLDCYERERVSKDLCSDFRSDAKSGKITFHLNDNGYITLERTAIEKIPKSEK